MSEYPRVHSQSVHVEDRLRDKVVIVVGAGSSGPGWGNGKAAAVTFARAGATVVCADLNAAAAEETARVITDEGVRATAVATDATSEEDVSRLIDQTIAEYSRIDILHNNVGIGMVGGASAVDRTVWDRVFATNTTSAMLTMKHTLPHMSEASSGVITNVSSIAGSRWAGVPAVAYGASKAALDHLTRLTASEYAGTGVRVNLIVPGMMRTPMVEEPKILSGFGSADFESMWHKRNSMIPMNRMGNAWDVAGAALFLASDDAAYVTGAALYIDGGLNLGKPHMGDALPAHGAGSADDDR